ncbi:MAG: c-type cytochrome [Alphaproteobacteria bacterium]|nr:c-type cytochrome [Alphaproteobacteria bacterium]
MKTVRTAAVLAALLAAASPARAEPAAVDLTKWKVPDLESLPPDERGQLVRYGRDLVVETYKHIGPEVADASKRFAGNNLACQSCHREGGTVPFSMSYVGVTSVFPQYRAREDAISTTEDRVNGCMERSMAGRTLPLDSREMKAFVAYMEFLSQGVPRDAKINGSGVKMVKMPDRMANVGRGAEVYKEQCVACHGDNGQGVRNGKAGDALGYQFPPLWGLDSYNQGAGMYRLAMATRFVLHNMPQGTTHEAPMLSLDDAYDVAAFINDQPRPAKANMEADFPNRLKKPADMPFPPYADGFSQAQHKYGPLGPIAAQLKKMQDEAAAKKP